MSVRRDDPAAQAVRRQRRAEPEPGSGGRAWLRGLAAQHRDPGDLVVLVDEAAAASGVERHRAADDGALPHGGDRRLLPMDDAPPVRDGGMRPGPHAGPDRPAESPGLMSPVGGLVLAATPLGDSRDASPRLRDALGDGRRRRRRGHPPAAVARGGAGGDGARAGGEPLRRGRGRADARGCSTTCGTGGRCWW